MDRLFCAELSTVARAAIESGLEGGLACHNKAMSGFDPVTEADRAAERAPRVAIEARYDLRGGSVVAAATLELYRQVAELLSGPDAIG